MRNKELTGNWYIRKKWFGFDIMVEAIYEVECEHDFTLSPPIKRYIKASEEDLISLNIKIL